MTDRLTADDLAERTGLAPQRVARLAELGILQPEDGTFARRDVMRARVAARLEALGIEPEALARALESGELRLGYLESAGRLHPRADRTFDEVGADIGVPFATLERLYVAFGLPRPEPDERVRQEDLEAIGFLPAMLAAGVEEERMLRLARVMGDSARRVAQYLPHHFHTTVEEHFRRRGLGDNEAYEAAIREVGLKAGRSGEVLLGWLFRRHSETYMTAHQFEHVETALADAGVRERRARTMEAIAFVDLVGFTTLTERLGDEAAAETALSLAVLVNELAVRHRGTTVKLLGDGALLHFPDPGDAVRCALDVVDAAPARGLPPAHVGIEAGPMLYEEGDYFGRTVNVAARIAAQAGAGQVYVGEALAEGVRPDGFRLVEVGGVELKGLGRPVAISEAIRAGPRPAPGRCRRGSAQARTRIRPRTRCRPR